jgi:hypothetical protein
MSVLAQFGVGGVDPWLFNISSIMRSYIWKRHFSFFVCKQLHLCWPHRHSVLLVVGFTINVCNGCRPPILHLLHIIPGVWFIELRTLLCSCLTTSSAKPSRPCLRYLFASPTLTQFLYFLFSI